MKIIHCADVHLGTKFASKFPADIAKQRQSELRTCFSEMIDFARQNGVQVILLSGDVFDSDKPTIKDKEFFYNAVRKNPEIDFLYLNGNHDKGYDRKPPEGCTCVDDDICVVNGIRVLGLGGSMRYRPGEPYMHTERQMARRARKLWWKLRRNKGFDILLAHAPAKGIGDMEDLPHRGFETFLTLMDRWRPRYLVYGHIHQEYGAMGFQRERKYGDTTCVNAYKRYVIEF